MQTTFATDAGTPGKPNEDFAVCGPDWAVILDGATAPGGVDSGCIHDVPWLVDHVAAGIVTGLMLTDTPLADILAEAIWHTCLAHESTCDLSNPDSPSSTVAIIRARDGVMDYLVLGDSPVVLRRGDDCIVRNGVTVGLRHTGHRGSPVVGNRVDIGAGAKVLGPIRIGDDVLIGANAVVLTDVPAYSIAVGVPARILPRKPEGRAALVGSSSDPGQNQTGLGSARESEAR